MPIGIGTNSYISVNEASDYHNGNVAGDSWSDLTENVKERSLITATRMLDRQRWQGTKTDPAQNLAWPRTGVKDRYGNAIDPAEVPQEVKDAQAELALQLALDPDSANTSNTNKGIKRVKAGSAEVEFFYTSAGSRFPVIINELIGSFLQGTSPSNLASVGGYASGTCERSRFKSGEFDLTEPL